DARGGMPGEVGVGGDGLARGVVDNDQFVGGGGERLRGERGERAREVIATGVVGADDDAGLDHGRTASSTSVSKRLARGPITRWCCSRSRMRGSSLSPGSWRVTPTKPAARSSARSEGSS